MTGFYILLRAHDHIWADRAVPLTERRAATGLIWDLILRNLRAARCGSVSIVERSERITNTVVGGALAGQ